MRAPAVLSAAELRGLLGSPNPPRVLDVRTSGEFEAVHIAGAYSVPLDLLREHRDEIRSHLDDHIVLVCQSGQRATQAEEALRAAGLANVHILDGGMTAWQGAGYTVNRGAQRWDLQRQVRFVAGTIVALSILASIVVPGMKWLAFAMGAGLSITAITNTCLMGMMLATLPYNRGPACDAPSIVAQLAGSGRRS
jgi:rhodanese-related sulfurtransferase